MSLFSFFRKPQPSANAARDRLRIVLAHERASSKGPDYLPKLHKDLIRVVRPQIQISGLPARGCLPLTVPMSVKIVSGDYVNSIRHLELR